MEYTSGGKLPLAGLTTWAAGLISQSKNQNY